MSSSYHSRNTAGIWSTTTTDDCNTYNPSSSTNNKGPSSQAPAISTTSRCDSWEESDYQQRGRRHSLNDGTGNNGNSNSNNSSNNHTDSAINRRDFMMRSRSLSHSNLASQSCAWFAPLPEYAKYQERKIMRALSRSSLFAEVPVSPHHNPNNMGGVGGGGGGESRQGRSTIPLDDLSPGSNSNNNNRSARQPASPATSSHDDGRGGQRSCSPNIDRNYIRSHSDSSIQRPQHQLPSLPIPVGIVDTLPSKRTSMDTARASFQRLDTPIITTPPPQQQQQQQYYQQYQYQQQRKKQLPPNKQSLFRNGNYNSNRATDPAVTTVEISPGVSAILRTKEETVEAIRHDFFLPVECLGCNIGLFCISDAQYVICPTCRVVSPLESYNDSNDDDDEMASKGGGLGLGMTFESLVAIQADILASRIQ